jgi:hypothetical protein
VCRPVALSAWIAELETVFAHLRRPQVKVLAEYSLGIMLAGRCGLSCVAFVLAQWLGQSFDTVRERVRDWYCGAADKSGRRRRELDVETCFGPLLAWVLRDWDGGDLAIALDATTLGERFVVLAISVVYRSCAIPVAWTVLAAGAKGAHKPHWLRLLQRFKDLVPPHLNVIVLADRGLYARWLFRAIVSLGWHPFLRINTYNAASSPTKRVSTCRRPPCCPGPAAPMPRAGRCSAPRMRACPAAPSWPNGARSTPRAGSC